MLEVYRVYAAAVRTLCRASCVMSVRADVYAHGHGTPVAGARGEPNMCPRSVQVYGSVGLDGKQTHGGALCPAGELALNSWLAGYADAIVVDHRFAFPLPQGGCSI